MALANEQQNLIPAVEKPQVPVAGVIAGQGHSHSAFLPPMMDFSESRAGPAGQWHTGMCDCFQDMTGCCEVLWCTYCHFGYQYHKVKTGELGPDWLMCFGLWCADILLKGGAYAVMMYDMREKVRARWNIDPQANQCTECCKAFCCPGLTHCQIYRELSYRGYWPGGVCVKVPPVAPIAVMQ